MRHWLRTSRSKLFDSSIAAMGFFHDFLVFISVVLSIGYTRQSIDNGVRGWVSSLVLLFLLFQSNIAVLQNYMGTSILEILVNLSQDS